MSDELFRKSASELSTLLDKKKISSVELTKAVIERTFETDGKVQAFLSLDDEATLHQAEASDKRRAKGEALSPLDGIPVSIKDNMAQAGQPMTCGSKILKDFISPYDSTVVAKLKNAGAVLWGRLNLDEFAMGSSTEHSAFKVTNNPWDTDRIPGGSSGGSSASVAAGETILSLGSDTGGSIRQPAAHCGIVGIKPTYGLVSRYGLTAFASSLDQIGPLARNVEDTANLLHVIAGHDRHDSTSYSVKIPNYRGALEQDGPWKLGIPKEYFGDGLSPEVRAAVEKVIKHYESIGCTIKDVSLPHTDLGVATYYIIAPAEASSNLARFDGIRYTHRSKEATDAINIFKKSREEGFGDEVKRRIAIGTFVLSSGYFDAYYLKAQKIRTLIRNDFEAAFKDVDAVLAPTTASTACKRGEKMNDPLAMYLEDIFTISANLSGLPAISTPCGFSSEGMPIGFQLYGKAYDESTLFAIAHAYEKAHDYKNKIATL